jgi:hypothetical protein
MAKSRFIQNAFTSGVLSPLLKGRTDIDQYYQGLEIGRDWVLMPQGGIRRRPGTEFIQKALPILSRNTTTNTMPNGGTGANISDEDDTTATVTTTNISTLDPYVVAKQDLGTATYIEVVDVRGIFLTSGTSSEFVVQSSTDDITYTTRATVPLIGTNSQDFRLAVKTSARYWRLARIGSTDLGANRVNLSDFNLWELTSTLSEVKLKDFSIESDRHYLFSFTDGNLRIFRKNTNVHVADIKVPYTTGMVKAVRDIQSESVMLLIQEDNEVKRVINLGTDTDWSIDSAPFTNIPQFDYNDTLSPTPTSDVQVLTFTAFVAGDTFQIDVEGIFSKNITFAGDATADEQSSTAENIRKNLQDMPNFGETGVSVARTGALQYTITVADESAKAFELFSAFPTSGTASKSIAFTHTTTGVPRKEDVWSSTRGYPKTGCFYEGRLVFGGTKSKPQSVFLSKSGSAFNFDIDEGDDDDAIFTTISSRKLNNIVDVFPGRNLQIFTDGSEFTVNVSPVTPTTFTITPQTSHGSLNMEAKEIDGATIFADRNGKSIKEYIFSFQEDAYTSRDASVLSPELIKTPQDIAILGGTSSDSANWVFIVNNDGSATVLNTLRSQDINGFTEWTTSGFIDDVSVVDDELYMINKRTIDGVESNFIERWDFDHYVDNGLTIANVAPLTEIAGLEHLEGATVKVAAIDPSNALSVIALEDRVVSSGKITLSSSETKYAKIQVGLSYIPTLKTMPINTNIGSGQNSMRRKKIVRMNMRIKDASGLMVDRIPLPVRFFDESTSSPLDSFPQITTGVIDDILGVLGWGVDEMPVFTAEDPTPVTILAIEYEVESS